MNRRDFLFLRRERELRVVELSCRTLYMRCLDAQITGTESADVAAAPDPWHAEPPAVLAHRSPSDLFREIRDTLGAADVLRIVDSRWAGDQVLKTEIDAVVHEFEGRGGRVERDE